MDTQENKVITIEATVQAPLEKVWQYWSDPKHIQKWCSASDDWHVPNAENDLRENGKFLTTMAAKDGSMSFDFEGTYTSVKYHQSIEYRIADGRKVTILFSVIGKEVKVTEVFEPEAENPIEMQRGGWQAILNNFKKYAEAN